MTTPAGRSETPDGTAYPWVVDLDGWWHMRPGDDEWIVSMDGPNARTVCGQAIGSVRVSEFRPDPGEQNVCSTCMTADARSNR